MWDESQFCATAVNVIEEVDLISKAAAPHQGYFLNLETFRKAIALRDGSDVYISQNDHCILQMDDKEVQSNYFK